MGTEKGTNFEHGGSDKKEADVDQFNKLKNVLGSLDWTFDYTDKQVKNFAEGGKVPKDISKLLDQAKGALERLSKDALKILKDPSKLSDKGKALRGHYNTAQQDLANVNHVVLFRELPNELPLTKDNFDACVFKVAQHVEALNQEVETSKAKVRAGSN